MSVAASGSKYTTSHEMTQYEFAYFLRQRAVQISRLLPSTIDTTGMTDPIVIAMEEIRAGKLPLQVVRVKNNGVREVINANILDASKFITYTPEFETKRKKEQYRDMFY